MLQRTSKQLSLFSSLEDMLNHRHPLFRLSNKINWQTFDDAFTPLYCSNNGRPAHPIRLMCGLLILKHLRNVSDETVVLQWSENAYYQYFCGQLEFTPKEPCDASELVHFRNRIGEKGMEIILAESIRVNTDHDDEDHFDTAFIDSTVQEKNVTYPTDAKLHKKIIKNVLKIAREKSLPLRQSYTRTLKAIYRAQRFRNHPQNRKKATKADRQLKTIAGRLVRELDRNLQVKTGYEKMFKLYYRVLSQGRESKNKVYSLHEPEVACISKGKEHKKYEFGNKVSILRSWSGLILGACAFRNEYDGHTIQKTLEQTQRMTAREVDKLAGDRGYRGVKQIGKTKILIPDVPKTKDTYYKRRKKHKLFCKRAGIEPTIGHLKNDYRLSRNFYKGVKGDAINVLLAAAAYNFERAMRVLLWLVKTISEKFVKTNFSLKYTF